MLSRSCAQRCCMSWESSRYTPCHSAFQVFSRQGAISPSPSLLCAPGHLKPCTALHNIINSSTSANAAATRAAPGPHECPSRLRGHPSSSQHHGALPHNTWRMERTLGKHLCTSVPIHPSPSSCSSSWAGSRLGPAPL